MKSRVAGSYTQIPQQYNNECWTRTTRVNRGRATCNNIWGRRRRVDVNTPRRTRQNKTLRSEDDDDDDEEEEEERGTLLCLHVVRGMLLW